MKNEKQEQFLQEESKYFCKGISEEAIISRRVFEKGEGVFLTDLDGNNYLDFSSGIFTNSVGQCHPYVAKRVKEQVDLLWNVHDFSTPERLPLCKLLKEFLPEHLDTYCFFSTGAETVEAALRAAHCFAKPEKQKVAALRYGFHGKTMGARMLVHWDVGNYSYPSNSVLAYSAYCYRCPFNATYPSCNLLCADLTVKQVASKNNIAALFFEPIQGATGIITPPKGYWEKIQEECKKSGILLIADEFLTGGGRTGKFLASEHYGLKPDVAILGKAFASGFPFAVLAGRREIINSDKFASPGSTSSTYSSNPVSMVACEATLEVIKNDNLLDDVVSLGSILKDKLFELKDKYKSLGDIRGLGLLYGLEFVKDKKTKEKDPKITQRIFQICLDKGLKICLGGNILRIAPPFICTKQHIEDAVKILDASIFEAEKELL